MMQAEIGYSITDSAALKKPMVSEKILALMGQPYYWTSNQASSFALS